MQGDGDFASEECIRLLKESDIVVTNPPFSKFREYVAQLIKYEKKFLILGASNAITYKEIFPLIKAKKIWLGTKSYGTDMLFDVPSEYAKELRETRKEGSAYRIIEGVLKARSQSIWYTNLQHKKRNEELVLYRTYSPEKYPHYDNYDAINVDWVKDIPKDWGGAMGVPISFLDKHNPEQFEIIGLDRPLVKRLTGKQSRFILNGKEIYARIVIRNKKVRQ